MKWTKPQLAEAVKMSHPLFALFKSYNNSILSLVQSSNPVFIHILNFPVNHSWELIFIINAIKLLFFNIVLKTKYIPVVFIINKIL